MKIERKEEKNGEKRERLRDKEVSFAFSMNL